MNKSETDWVRIDAMSDEDIDFSDCPEVTPEMFSKATVRYAADRIRTVAHARGFNWDKMTEDEREDFIDNVVHEV
jgi:hypothetical protein